MNTFFDSSPEFLTIATDLYDENGILLLAKGVSVSKEILEKLQSRKLAKSSNTSSAGMQQEPVPANSENLDHQSRNSLVGDDLFSVAACITRQAIDSIQANPHIKAKMRTFTLNKAWIYDHSLNVAQLSTQIALKLALQKSEVITVSLGALLHDIGRTVTENTTTSFVMADNNLIGSSVKHHPVIGSSLLQKAGLPESVCLVALQHHERFSGNGYPRGLTYGETHLHAQIVMLADVFEALTTRRLKERTFSIAEGLDIIKRGRGIEYNPDILDALTELLQDRV